MDSRKMSHPCRRKESRRWVAAQTRGESISVFYIIFIATFVLAVPAVVHTYTHTHICNEIKMVIKHTYANFRPPINRSATNDGL